MPTRKRAQAALLGIATVVGAGDAIAGEPPAKPGVTKPAAKVDRGAIESLLIEKIKAKSEFANTAIKSDTQLIGGHSLLVADAFKAVAEELGVKLPRGLFLKDMPTVGKMAAKLESLRKAR